MAQSNSRAKRRYGEQFQYTNDDLEQQMQALDVSDEHIEMTSRAMYTFEKEVIVAVVPFYCVTWCSTDGYLYSYEISIAKDNPTHRTKLADSHGFGPGALPMMSLYSDVTKNTAVCAIVDGTFVRIWDMKAGNVIFSSYMGTTNASALLVTHQWVIVAHSVVDSNKTFLVFEPWWAKIKSLTTNLGQKPFTLAVNVERVDSMGIILTCPGLVYIGTSSGLLYVDTMLPMSDIAVVQCMEELLQPKWNFDIEDKMQAFSYRQECSKYRSLPVQGRLDVRQQKVNANQPESVVHLNNRKFKKCSESDVIVGMHSTKDIMSILTLSECLFVNKETRCILPLNVEAALAICATQDGMCFVLNADLRVLAINAFSKSSKPDVNSIFIEDGKLEWKFTEPMSPQLMMSESEIPSSVWVHGYTNTLFLVDALPNIP